MTRSLLLICSLLLATSPALAVEAAGHGVSSLPTPLAMPLPGEADLLESYENMIEGMDQDPVPGTSANPPRTDSQGRLLPTRPIRRPPSVHIYQGGGDVRRGTTRENGVTVYRGITPSDR